MKIIVVGTGYVGLVHAAVCAEYGHQVYGYDIDAEKIAAFNTGNSAEIRKYVNEPGLAGLVREYVNRNLFFTTDVAPIIEEIDVIFLSLPAPTLPSGETDMTAYRDAATYIAKLLARRKNSQRVVITDKSTVPIGSVRILEQIMKTHGVQNFGVASNPEFLAEGSAVAQARKPSRVVVGCDHPEDFKILRRVYSQFVNHVRIKYIETTPETAEAIKYVSNAMLLMYISFWNGVGARIGENIPNVRVDDLRRGVTADERISTWGSYMSNGAGGNCFGKDIRALMYQLQQCGVDVKLLEATFEINEYQKVYLIEKAKKEAGFDFRGKTVALLGLAFKKQSTDVRDASSIKTVECLLSSGVKRIKAYDPLALEEAKKEFAPTRNPAFERIEYCQTAQSAISGTDALFISTDWEEFRGLSYTIENTVSPPYLIIDGRRMIPDYDDLVERGYTYLAVGSPTLKPQKPVAVPG